MSQANAETIRRAYEVWNESGPAAVTEQFWAEDAVYREGPGWPNAGVYRGRAAALERMEALVDLFGPLEVRVDELIEVHDGRFVACTRMVGEGARDAPYTQSFAVVHRLRDGLIVEADYYLDRAQALQAVGLSEQAMSRENVEIVRRIIEDFIAGTSEFDSDGTLTKIAGEDLFDPDIEWDASGSPMPDIGGVYRGRFETGCSSTGRPMRASPKPSKPPGCRGRAPVSGTMTSFRRGEEANSCAASSVSKSCQTVTSFRIPASRTTGVEWGQAVGGISKRMIRQTRGHVGGVEMNTMTLVEGVHHMTFLTQDLDRLAAFYERVFDATKTLDMTEEGVRHVFLEIGPTTVLHPFQILERSALPPAPGTMFQRGRLDHFALLAPSEEAFREIRRRIESEGAADGDIRDMKTMWIMAFHDPDDFYVEVIWRKPGVPDEQTLKRAEWRAVELG